MCLHIFTYYPRMKNLAICLMGLLEQAWADMLNKTESVDFFVVSDEDLKFVCSPSVNITMLPQWLMERQWTPERIEEWTNRFGELEVKYIDETDITEAELIRSCLL